MHYKGLPVDIGGRFPYINPSKSKSLSLPHSLVIAGIGDKIMKALVVRVYKLLAKCLKNRILLCLFLIPLLCSIVQAQATTFLGMGDSIGEGVQSADSNYFTQPCSYLNLIAKQAGVGFPLPLIKTNPAGVVGKTVLRHRVFPHFATLNLAVSGADVNSLLNDQANAQTVHEIDSETDLVLFPRLGSQIQIAETYGSDLIVCWIGNNDVLSAVITFYQYDASQMTPIEDFRSAMYEITARLVNAGQMIVFGNIPDVTDIAFLVDRQDLIKFLGSDYGLPEGDYTSIVVMLLIRLGLDDGSLLQDPNFVLDAGEVQLIEERIEVFNQIIEDAANSIGMPVVDIHAIFLEYARDPPVFFDIHLTPRYLGGIFSLDGVHPSNIAHALVADAFIERTNLQFDTNIPLISEKDLEKIFLRDPFVDKNANGKVRGRPGAGMLETLGPFLGISGDRVDFLLEDSKKPFDSYSRRQFIERFLSIKGKDVTMAPEWNRDEAIEAFREIFGLKVLKKAPSLPGSLSPGP